MAAQRRCPTNGSRPPTILFITPPYHCGIVEIAGRWIPLNFVHLAGSARLAGVEARIHDAMARDHGYPEIEACLRETSPVYVATSAVTATINDAIATLELAKRVEPRTVTILGGIHPTFMYDEVLATSPAVDYIVIGEGEETLRELLAALEAGKDPAAVSGLAFRRDGETVVTPRRPLMETIDELPAAWDLLDWQHYEYFVMPGSRMGAVCTSRGCTHGCTFCSQGRFWGGTWRGRDPGRVVAELERLHGEYGIDVFLLTDEHPTLDRARWEAFLDLLIARNLPIHLLMETRADDIVRDREIMDKYRAAGVIYISIGVDSPDQATLDALGKGMSADLPKQALELIHGAGIVSEASFMIGFPDETPESVKNTFERARYCNPDNANFFALTPWPYSDIHRDVAPLIRERDYSRYNLVDPVVEPKRMSLFQVEMAIIDCYRKFYMGKIIEVMTLKESLRRSCLIRFTKLFMGSSFVFKKLGTGILGKLGMKG